MIAYKVFYKGKNGWLWSLVIEETNFRVHYLRKGENIPKIKGTGLLAFPTKHEALRFALRYPDKRTSVWKVKGRKVRLSNRRLAYNFIWRDAFEKVWRNKPPNLTTSEWPEGTIALSKVELIDEVRT